MLSLDLRQILQTKMPFSQKFCQKSRISPILSKINIFVTTASFPHCVSSGVAGPLAAQGGCKICRPFVLGF